MDIKRILPTGAACSLLTGVIGDSDAVVPLLAEIDPIVLRNIAQHDWVERHCSGLGKVRHARNGRAGFLENNDWMAARERVFANARPKVRTRGAEVEAKAIHAVADHIV